MADDKPVKEPEVPEEPVKEPEEPKEPEQPEQPEVPAEKEEPPEPESEGQPPAEEPKQPEPSRRENRRIQQLVEKLRARDSQPPPKPEGIDYREMVDADDEVYKQLETKSREFGQNQFQAGLQQAESIQFRTRLEIDAPKVESKYPQFNKEAPEFNPTLASAINEWYLASVGYDPKTNTVQNSNVRYSEFVEGIMELSETIASNKNAKTATNIAKQAASTGLRPDGSSAKSLDLNKAPEDMTDEELEAVVKQTLPRDPRGRFVNQK